MTAPARVPGFYWVKDRNFGWVVGHWDGATWEIVSRPHDERRLLEIGRPATDEEAERDRRTVP